MRVIDEALTFKDVLLVPVRSQVKKYEKRVFRIDTETLRECGAAVKVVAWIEDSVVIGMILDHISAAAIAGASPNPGHRRLSVCWQGCKLNVGGRAVANWTLSTRDQDYAYNGDASGDITVEFDNDASGRDVILDYIVVNGEIRQAENMAYNTATYDGGCGGGSYSQMMHCNGVIGFGNTYDCFSGNCTSHTGANSNTGSTSGDSTGPSPITGDNCSDAPVNGNVYSIINLASGQALDVAHNAMENGGNLLQWPYKSSNNQQFQLNDLGNGYWSIYALHSGRYLDVSESSTQEGANVHQWDYWGGSNQQWQLKQSTNGAFNIVARHSGKSLSVGSSSFGDNVYQGSDTASGYQRWYFNPANGSCNGR